MHSRATRLLGMVLFLLFPVRAFGAQVLQVGFDGFLDFNGNGLIDCSELVTYRITLSQDQAPIVPEQGTVTVPSVIISRFRLKPASIVYGTLDGCTLATLDGNDPNDITAIVEYSCDPHAADPLDSTYSLEFRISGEYLGFSPGPISMTAENDRTSPTTFSQTSTTQSAGPLNPCPPPPDLRLTKTLISGEGTPGATLVYGISVANIGNGDGSNVVLEENVPQLTSFDAANSSAGWTCAPNGNAGSSCTLSVGSLPAGASVSRTFAVDVVSSFPQGAPPTIDNTACASSNPPDDFPGNDCGSTSTPAGNPDLRVTKSVISGSGDPGSTLVYNLAVANIGSLGAAGVVLTETVPALSTFLPGSS